MNSLVATVAQLSRADQNATVTLRQQVFTTLNTGTVDAAYHTALRMGLDATLVSGRGWINKPHLITVKGRVADVRRWVIYLSGIA